MSSRFLSRLERLSRRRLRRDWRRRRPNWSTRRRPARHLRTRRRPRQRIPPTPYHLQNVQFITNRINFQYSSMNLRTSRYFIRIIFAHFEIRVPLVRHIIIRRKKTDQFDRARRRLAVPFETRDEAAETRRD